MTSAHHVFKLLGVTIVEVLIVTAIVAVLTAIGLPAISAAIRSAAVTDDIGKLRQLGVAAALYQEDEGKQALTVEHLVKARRIPVKLATSKLDVTTEGIANLVRDGTPFLSPSPIRITFVGLGDYRYTAEAVERFGDEISENGWLVNLSISKLRSRGEYGCLMDGLYHRLLNDGSVRVKRHVLLPWSLDGKPGVTCSPYWLFFDIDKTWKQAFLQRG